MRNLKQNLGITFARLVWADSAEQQLSLGDITGAVQFIHETRSKGISVLVHCVMGISRSATLVVAYMVAATKKSVDECVAELKMKRAVISPNENFLNQLKGFEEELQKMELPELKQIRKVNETQEPK